MPNARSKPPWRIVVLSGADSAEREVSLRSGAAVATALETAGHQVTRIDPAETSIDSIDWSQADACFVALHGGAGEDGRVQLTLERLRVPYTGSGPDACRLAMSKSASKERFLELGVPTLPYALIDADTLAEDAVAQIEQLGYPLIIKPDQQGSSVGIQVIEDPMQVPEALCDSRRHGAACLVEPLVTGREFTVAVLDDRPLPLLEITTPERVFSYDAKYNSSRTETLFDFDLAEEKRAEISAAALAAARALGTSGLVRVDVMLGFDARVWVLEVNTIPGMTPRSLAPLAARQAGIEMPRLCDLLVRRALGIAEDA